MAGARNLEAEQGRDGKPEPQTGKSVQGKQIGQIEQTKQIEQTEQIEAGYSLAAVVQTREQAEQILSAMECREGQQQERIQEYLIVDADLLMEEERLRERLSAGKIRWGIKCPAILRKSDEKFLERLRRVIERGKPDIIYCATIDMLAWVKSISYAGQIAGEASLYAWNAAAVSFWGTELHRVSIPFELSSREIRELCAAVQKIDQNSQLYCGETLFERIEAPVYGRVPFMVSANCVKLSAGHCDKNRKKYAALTDRLGNTFPVYTNCIHCYNVIYNHLPTSYAEDLWMLIEDNIKAFRVEFTSEGGAEAVRVLQTFKELLASETERRDEGKARRRGKADGRKRAAALEKTTGKSVKQKRGRSAGAETTKGRFRLGVE